LVYRRQPVHTDDYNFWFLKLEERESNIRAMATIQISDVCSKGKGAISCEQDHCSTGSAECRVGGQLVGADGRDYRFIAVSCLGCNLAPAFCKKVDLNGKPIKGS